MFSKKVWKRFVQEGVLDESRLSRRVAESWYRSQQAGVNPYGGEGRLILSREHLSDRKAQNRAFLDIATPFVKQLYRYIKGSGAIILLIDPEGFVLTMTGDAPVLQRAQAIKFVEGVKWTEDEVGTNAIGTSLQAKEPIMLAGAEHYAVASQDWMCAAAPIRDENGNLLGVLDVSSPVEKKHPHTLAAVVSTAYAIEQEWQYKQKLKELELLRYAPFYFQDDQPAVLCNHNNLIVYCSRSLSQEYTPRKHSLDDVISAGYLLKDKQPIKGEDGSVLGYKVSFLPEPRHFSTPQTYNVHGTSSSYASHHHNSSLSFKGEKGTSPVFNALLHRISQVAQYQTDVYIWGETGTGKELIAKTIHENSDRANGPFVAINCGAIPAELLESELFGYAPGAFTGAKKGGYKGRFEQAQHGTLFLDEVSELPLSMQVALLRVLEAREVTPIGSPHSVQLDIRVISASNRHIKQLVREGQFREDLFYRLYRFPLYVPALRERPEDIPFLIRHYCTAHNWQREFPQDVIQALMAYPWPGNVRELFNVLEQMRIVAGGETPTFADLPPEIRMSGRDHLLNPTYQDASCFSEEVWHTEEVWLTKENSGCSLPEQGQQMDQPNKRGKRSLREQIQKENIIRTLRQTNGNITQAAKMLNVSRSTFYRLLKKYPL
jgi:transcriptional regulator of acetoin/glycerol metabolism